MCTASKTAAGRFRPRPVRLAVVLSVLATACSPALNWRDVRPQGGVVTLQFPCRPGSAQRTIDLGGVPVSLQLMQCDADGLTWAFAQADVGALPKVQPALQALRQAALANVGAGTFQPITVRIAGARAGDAVEGLALEGHLPGGDPVRMRVVVFASGTHVHQATVFGPTVPTAAAGTFFNSIKVGS